MYKLDYGSFLYIDAKQPSTLKMIKTIYSLGLRLATGAFRSSPIPSILNIANTPPLDLKTMQNVSLHKVRRAQNIISPNLKSTINFSNFKFNCSGIFKYEHPITPPWAMELLFNTDLARHYKNETMVNIYRSLGHLYWKTITTSPCFILMDQKL